MDNLSGLPIFQHHPHLFHQSDGFICFDPYISSCVLKFLNGLGFVGLKSAFEPYRAQLFVYQSSYFEFQKILPPCKNSWELKTYKQPHLTFHTKKSCIC